jgi:hypothetical protein
MSAIGSTPGIALQSKTSNDNNQYSSAGKESKRISRHPLTN